jgi:hypothetical protein
MEMYQLVIRIRLNRFTVVETSNADVTLQGRGHVIAGGATFQRPRHHTLPAQQPTHQNPLFISRFYHLPVLGKFKGNA